MMQRGKLSYRCSICQHEKRLEIDRQLVQGIRKKTIAERYGVSTAALLNHEREHISRQLAQAMAKKQALESLNLSEEMEGLYHRAKAILDRAEAKGKDYLALDAIAEMRNICGLLSKVALELHGLKILELELERERSGDAQRDRELEQKQKLGILNDAELAVWERLSLKIQRQSKEQVIIEKPNEWTFKLPKTVEENVVPVEEEPS